MLSLVLNAGKNTLDKKAYQPSCAAPDSHLQSVPQFPQTGQFPPLKPDNKVGSYKKYFSERLKKDIFTS
jgi:hypothetical protein